MAVEISGITLRPSDDLITGVWLDTQRTDPVDRYAHSVVARCELDVSLWKPIGTLGLAAAFIVGVSLGVDRLENQYGNG
jgi:hypothetical protein